MHEYQTKVYHPATNANNQKTIPRIISLFESSSPLSALGVFARNGGAPHMIDPEKITELDDLSEIEVNAHLADGSSIRVKYFPNGENKNPYFAFQTYLLIESTKTRGMDLHKDIMREFGYRSK